MALRERFGKLVLLEETDADSLGREYRAVRLGPNGFDRFVSVQRFGPALVANPDAAKRLMDQTRLVARLQNPGLVRLLGIGRVEQSYYVSSEPVEGRTLKAVLERCRRESFPFAADHALMVASRTASALEYVHEKKDEAGSALFHGLLTPSRIVVAFDGEVKVKGLGLWSSLRGTDLLGPDERRYLAPEQAAGGAGDARSDVYALGLALLEALTVRPPDGGDPLAKLPAVRLSGPAGDESPLPTPLAEVLRRALAAEPPGRFTGMAEMRRAIDVLLFSGDFTPTTFDLAFFMHTLFREEMEREVLALEEARRADYGEFLMEEKPPTPSIPAGRAPAAVIDGPAPMASEASTATTEVFPPAPATEEPAPPSPAEMPSPMSVGPTRPNEPVAAPLVSAPSAEARTAEAPLAGREGPSRVSREAAAREAASRLTFHRQTETSNSRRWLWLLGGLLAAAALGGGSGYLYFVQARLRVPPPPPTKSAEEVAALSRVRELEERIATLEREKAEAEARAAEDARRKLESQAAARGQAVDPAAVERVQEEARRRARAEEEQRQQEERRRLAEQKKAEERIATAPRAAETTPAPTPEPTPTPTSTPTPPPTPMPTPEPEPPSTPPPVRPGTLVTSEEPGVAPPTLLRDGPVGYPDRARELRAQATVVVRALVDEKGNVAEVTVVQRSGTPLGFDEAAVRRVKGRLYRPATKDGVPVRMWVSVRVEFRL